jgi:ribonuclease BN (tRNA processing enzyme)
MRVRLVDSTCGASSSVQYATSFIVNDTIAVDAGPLGFWRTPDDQARIRHVILTHSHLDHLATLGIFVENAYRPGRECLTVWGSAPVLTSLREDIFNGRVWPNLLELPSPHAPMAKLAELTSEVPITVEGLRITPVPVSHTVPTFGMVLEEHDTAVVIVSDTGPTDRIWDVMNALPHLKAVYLEATFPNDMPELTEVSRHLMPSSFAIELEKLRRPATVLAVHLKARYRDRVASELRALGADYVRVAEPGREYIW